MTVKIFGSISLVLTFALSLFSSCTASQTTIQPQAELTTNSERGKELAPVSTKVQDTWEKIVAEARKEGTVAVYGANSADLGAALGGKLKERYGIRLESVTARGGEIGPKILAERRAGISSTDIYVGGSTTIVTTLIPINFFQQAEPHLFLPEVLDSSKWWLGKIRYLDSEHQVISVAAFPVPPMTINTNMVKPNEIESYKDLLDSKWKGKILMNDVTIPGVGANWFGTVVGKVLGYDYARQLAKQEPLIFRDQRLMVTWVAQGKYPLALAPRWPDVFDFMNAGASISGFTPKSGEGAYVSSGAGIIGISSTPLHLNASIVFTNWFLSQEGQTLYTRVTGFQSRRIDTPTDHIHALAVRDSSINYLDGDDPEYQAKMPERSKIAQEIFGNLMK